MSTTAARRSPSGRRVPAVPGRPLTESALEQRQAAASRACLNGDLDLVGLATLLTLVDMERRSGVLLVYRQGAVGRLWLARGRVLRAQVTQLEGRVRRTGREAVYHVLEWHDGRFELHPMDVEGADEIGMPTTHLLMEAARVTDELNADHTDEIQTEAASI
jgi:two-component system, OmpR family, response regulator